MSDKSGYLYILANESNTTLYTGVTRDLEKRLHEHRNGITGGFAERYNTKKLVYVENFDSIEDAIKREKQIKAGSRRRKIKLIESMNPGFKDLSGDL